MLVLHTGPAPLDRCDEQLSFYFSVNVRRRSKPFLFRFLCGSPSFFNQWYARKTSFHVEMCRFNTARHLIWFPAQHKREVGSRLMPLPSKNETHTFCVPVQFVTRINQICTASPLCCYKYCTSNHNQAITSPRGNVHPRVLYIQLKRNIIMLIPLSNNNNIWKRIVEYK